VVSGIALVVLVLFVGTLTTVLRIRADMNAGRRAISGLQLDNLDAGLAPTVAAAVDRIDDADRRANDSPFLKALSLVPVVRGQVDAVRDLTHVAADLGATARTSTTTIDNVLQKAGEDPSARIELLDTVLEQLDVIEAAIRSTDIDTGGRLVGPLSSARSKVVSTLDKAPSRLAEARFYVSGLRRLLAGPSRYLVLAANNAEMRGGAGMPLSGGVVTIENGDIEFGSFEQLAPQLFPKPTDFQFPKTWVNTYGRWAYGQNYLETAVSPNFGTTGPAYVAMAPNAGFGPVDGVIEIDVVALRELIKVIGPVELDGVTYDETNIEQEILNENYLRFATIEGDRDERMQLQSALATRIFDAFKERDIPVADLAFAMRTAAISRHLLAYSKDAAVQDLWASIGADGVLQPDSLMVTVQNVAANKLDWYINPRVVLNVLPGTDGYWKARLTVVIENPEVERSSPQVDGTYDGLTNGTHRALVAVYLPKQAVNVRALDVPFSEYGVDPPLNMAGMRVEIPRGTTRRVALEFSLPKDVVGAQLVPAGRVRPMFYTVNNHTMFDFVVSPITWVLPPAGDRSVGAPGVAGLLTLFGALAVLVHVRARLRVIGQRPIRPLGLLAQRAPTLAALLFLAALGALLAGALINSGASG
jgi:hypothetical protein